MSVKWSAVAIDAALITFIVVGLGTLHYIQTHHPKPAVVAPQVIPTPSPSPPVVAPLPAPKPAVAPEPEASPKAAHKVAETKEKRPTCEKAKAMAEKYGLNKDNFEGPARDYGLNSSQIAFVRKCLGG